MNYRGFILMATLGVIAVAVLLAPASAAGQDLSAAAKTTTTHKAWIPPRTADGQPDLQGVWTNNTVTPLERPNVAPLLPTAYNSNLQIVQGSGYVAVETEEIHDVRIIPTDGRPHIPKSIHQWYGDSVGHWEGNTLVIDTTNFTDLSPFRGAQNLHMIERLTRADEDTILYQFTVEDPGMWTKPWSGELPIVKIQGQLYEYACHEANYALADTLRGARVTEEQAAKKSAK